MSPVFKMSGGTYYVNMLAGYVKPFGGDFYNIATATSAGTATTYTFSSIPQDFKHLEIRARVLQSGGTGYSNITFNGDTGANYSFNRSGQTNAAIASNSVTNTSIPTAYSVDPTTYPSYAVIRILNFRDTSRYKNLLIKTGVAAGSQAASMAQYSTGQWRNTAAVTSITITTDGSSWAANSQFALYGEY